MSAKRPKEYSNPDIGGSHPSVWVDKTLMELGTCLGKAIIGLERTIMKNGQTHSARAQRPFSF